MFSVRNASSLTLGKAEDPVVYIRRLGRLQHVHVTSFLVPVPDVVPDVLVKQHGVLRHHPDLFLEGFLCYLDEGQNKGVIVSPKARVLVFQKQYGSS